MLSNTGLQNIFEPLQIITLYNTQIWTITNNNYNTQTLLIIYNSKIIKESQIHMSIKEQKGKTLQ